MIASIWRMAASTALLLLLTSVAAVADKRIALVIGNSAYQHAGRLPNPVNDARSMADLLTRADFDVVQARSDVTNLEFKREIREFTEKARGADIAVIFFAGHGIEITGTNYLVPVDARLAKDLDAEDEAVPLDRLVRAIEASRRLRLVLLDACRDNPFAASIERTFALRAVTNGLAKVEPSTSDTLIAYAAKAGSVAVDGNGPNSPFTAALLRYIAEPGLDIRLALGRVRDDVLQSTGNKQEPFVYGSLGGATVSLVPPPASKPSPPPTTGTIEIRQDYEYAERLGTRTAWEAFLSVYTTGFYANLARAQLAKLVSETVRTVGTVGLSEQRKPTVVGTDIGSYPHPRDRCLQTGTCLGRALSRR